MRRPLLGIYLIVCGGMLLGATVTNKFTSVVTLVGTYDTHNRITLTWTDTRWHSTREQCLKRAQEISKDVSNRIWYWRGLKLDRSPSLNCK